MRVGKTERTFAMLEAMSPGEPDIKYVGFKKGKETDFYNLPVGTELIVSYVFKRPKLGGDSVKIIRKLTSTGKVNRQTKSCGFAP
jgi:hypothetical protein